jgi:hypothetical protein
MRGIISKEEELDDVLKQRNTKIAIFIETKELRKHMRKQVKFFF